jgi:hypothetical protein
MQQDCPSKRTIIATTDCGYVSASDSEDENIIVANISCSDDGDEEVLGTSATNNYRTFNCAPSFERHGGRARQMPMSQPFQHVSCRQGLPCAYNH